MTTQKKKKTSTEKYIDRAVRQAVKAAARELDSTVVSHCDFTVMPVPEGSIEVALEIARAANHNAVALQKAANLLVLPDGTNITGLTITGKITE